jgi:hypothetical protein
MNHHQTQCSVAVAVAAVQIKRVLFPFLAAEAGLCQWMCHPQMLTLAEGGFLNSTNLQRRAVLLLRWTADPQSPSTSQKDQGHYRSGSIDREEMYLVAVAAACSQREVERVGFAVDRIQRRGTVGQYQWIAEHCPQVGRWVWVLRTWLLL